MNKFTDWGDYYASHLMSPDDAVRLIPGNAAVALPPATSVPTLGAALMRRADELPGTHVYIPAATFDPGWFNPGHPNVSVHVETFVTVPSRGAFRERRVDYTPILLSQRFKAEQDGRAELAHHPDVVLLSVSPPDQFGYCSFGLGMWSKAQYIKQAKIVIAELNSAHPRTFGDNRVHITEFDAMTLSEAASTPPAAVAPRPLEPGIVNAVAELVRNGDTIQIGVGDRTGLLCVSGTFNDKRDLGYHGELCPPGINDLVRNGIINGSRKNLHAGKFVATQLIASSEDELNFIHDNPVYEVYDVSYTNDPRIIGSHDNMVAINNALAVDFSGQITAESIDGQLWSGPGGQPEFAMGAHFSKGGRNITVVESTAKNGTVSRIMPGLPPGTTITVPNYLADYVVTEFGIASLLGKSDSERARELISVAHPDHRDDLRRAASQLLG